jgi:hypothetical protein
VLKDKTVFEETHKEHGESHTPRPSPPLSHPNKPNNCPSVLESFLSGLAEFEKYLTTLKSPTDFSGDELLRIMKSFQEPFEQHFHSEIATIAKFADHLNAPKQGTPEYDAAGLTFKTWGKSTVTKAGMTDVVPFFLLNLDRTVEDGLWANWPPMPAPIKWGLINLAGAWHSGFWRFSSCDSSGKPQELWAFRAGNKADQAKE